jgi:hypothetical protein
MSRLNVEAQAERDLSCIESDQVNFALAMCQTEVSTGC